MEKGKKELDGKLNYACVPLETMQGVIRVFEKGAKKI